MNDKLEMQILSALFIFFIGIYHILTIYAVHKNELLLGSVLDKLNSIDVQMELLSNQVDGINRNLTNLGILYNVTPKGD